MITLQSIKEPLGLSIGLSEEVPVENPPDMELLLEALRIVATAQAREEVTALREELSEARKMIRELEGMLNSTLSPDPSPARERGVSQRAQEILEQEPLFIDYETTGLSKDAAVVEVAVIDGEGRVLLSTMVNPRRHIPAEITAINGVRDQDVADAPTWEEIAPQLEALIAGRMVVAHNAKFEAKWTPKEWGVRWVCSKRLADQALGKAGYMEIMHDRRMGGGLEARLWQCGLQPGPEHTAAGDCISTLRLVRHLAGEDRPVELKY